MRFGRVLEWRRRRWRLLSLVCGTALAVAAGLDAWSLSRLEAPRHSVFLTDRHGAYLGQISFDRRGQYGHWPLEDVPERIALATLSLEDRRFWSHPGVDPAAVGRAAWQNLSSGRRVSGASTIAMQVVRLQTPMRRSLVNKVREALGAVFLTARHGRDAVLRHYLRLVPYGNGSHGIRHAARFYFDKPATDLSWAEIAYLAAIPQAPTRMNPYRPSGRIHVNERAGRILSALEDKGVIDAGDLDLARSQLARLEPEPRDVRPAEAMHALMSLAGDIRANPPATPMLRASLDLGMQKKAHAAFAEQMAHWRSRNVDHGAVLIADRKTMAVRVLLGSADYFDENAGALDYTALPRSPGSSLKPFIYALALETGDLTPTQVLMDVPERALWAENADRKYLGPILPRQALANSRNVPAVHLVRIVGLAHLYDFFERLGLHEGRRQADYFGAGIAIGTLPVRLRDSLAAYGALANDGRYRPLRWFEDAPEVPARKVMRARTARLITDFLSDPAARMPTFERLGPLEYPFPAALKTGTSQHFRDAWTIGYTPDLVIGVWMGRADGKPMGRVTGGGGAAHLLRAVLMRVSDPDRSGSRFASPNGMVSAQVCATTGLPPAGRCPAALQEWVDPAAMNRPAAIRPARGDPDLIEQRMAVQLRIAGPPDGGTVFLNPEAPEDLNVVRLRADIDPVPPSKMVLWYLNGRPHRMLPADRPLDWTLRKGEHTFQIRLPHRPERSAVHMLTVQ